MKGYFLDSNILISAFNDKHSNENQILKQLLSETNSKIFISPLVMYEVLRGIKGNEQYEEIKEKLSYLAIINIDSDIAELASRIFLAERLERERRQQQAKKINKHNFDIMHFATAKVNKLEILSKDRDMDDWNDIYTNIISLSDKKETMKEEV